MDICKKTEGYVSRWTSWENPTGAKGKAATENSGAKGHAFHRLLAGETLTLLDMTGAGQVRRIWMTLSHFASAYMMRSLVIRMYWVLRASRRGSSSRGLFLLWKSSDGV
jgi:hypothetical protein